MSLTRGTTEERMASYLDERNPGSGDRLRELFANDRVDGTELREAIAKNEGLRDNMYFGMMTLVQEAIQDGRTGRIRIQRLNAKTNARLYVSRPYLFGLSGLPFNGACSIAETRKWLADEGIDESLTNFFQMFVGCLHNISKNENEQQADKNLKTLLAELKVEYSREG